MLPTKKILLKADTPKVVSRISKFIGLSFFIIPLITMLLPWQQNITANGQVTAFSASERIQNIDAPVSGMINKWYIEEGSVVKKGDILLEISDIDPMFKDRLEFQRNNLETKLSAKRRELEAYKIQKQSLISSRDAKIAAAKFKLDVANQKILASSESVSANEATFDAAEFQAQRLDRLLKDGLVSKRDSEVAERDLILAKRGLNSAKANFNSAKAEAESAKSDIQQIQAETKASLDSNEAIISKIKGELADSENILTNAEINLSRQSMQKVIAPRDGIIFRLPINTQSQVVSQGQPLLTIIPDAASRAVQLWVDGRDAPLITNGSEVILEFEGWPAVQVAGWPKAGFGTFRGKVAFVDSNDNGRGNFRVMVVPDASENWPQSGFLRQGVSAKGWVLLTDVYLGYELWRLVNNFPARLPDESTSNMNRFN